MYDCASANRTNARRNGAPAHLSFARVRVVYWGNGSWGHIITDRGKGLDDDERYQ